MKNKRMAKVPALAALVFLALSISIHAQRPVIGRATIKTAEGNLFIQNGHVKSFTLEFNGTEVIAKTIGGNPAFEIDGKLVQVIIVENRSFLDGIKVVDEQKILEIHRDWESDYLQKESYKIKFNVESEKVLVGERKTLFWGFVRPDADKAYDRDYFMTMVIGAGLVGLTSPIKRGEATADYKNLFTKIFSTIKISDTTFDVLKLADEIRESKKKVN